jgi:hypothetical protein
LDDVGGTMLLGRPKKARAARVRNRAKRAWAGVKERHW